MKNIYSNKNQSVIRSFAISRILLSAITLIFISNIGFAKDFQVNASSSTLEWEAKKVTGQHSGTISFGEGILQVDKKKISGAKIAVDMNTLINTDGNGVNKNLVGHLKSDDFFSVEKFPQASLEVKKVEAKSGDLYHFTADLTIKGITAPVEFDAEVILGSGQLTATGIITVNRTKYDIKYRSASFFSDLGDKMIYDDFTLKFKLVATSK
jgi:polyisoprenoid-binding protein YceI